MRASDSGDWAVSEVPKSDGWMVVYSEARDRSSSDIWITIFKISRLTFERHFSIGGQKKTTVTKKY